MMICILQLFCPAGNMPLVRLAEMYLILMEVGTLEEANVAYETLSRRGSWGGLCCIDGE